jgi:hypothetical protein
MEDCAINVHLTRRRLFDVPVGNLVFRRSNALDNPIAGPRPVAANEKDASASVRISNSQDRVPIRPRACVGNIVNKPRGLKTVKFPTREARHAVRAGADRRPILVKCLPGPATADIVGRPAPRGERSGTC